MPDAKHSEGSAGSLEERGDAVTTALREAPPTTQDSVRQDPSVTGRIREWYGLPVVLIDIVSSAAIGAGLLASEHDHDRETTNALVFGGIGLYAFGGPAVHVIHGNLGRGFASLGMRIGLPLVAAGTVGMVTALAYSGCRSSEHCNMDAVAAGAAIGAVTGAVAAPILDSSVLAFQYRRDGLAIGFVPSFQPLSGESRSSLLLFGLW